jgi:hypothetical protein
MFKKKQLLLLLIIVSMGASSCIHESDLAGAPVITYSGDTQRILSANCNFPSCHGGSEVGLTTYNEVMDWVEPGKPRNSELYRLITGRAAEKMPPSGYPEVSNADLRLIYLWIEQGAKNN